ncbi:putative CAMK CAMKL CHK1 protein kinase [Lyophyllum shimeji]|uniref:CAMK CAMKL CHK1 protein kinase n=1 Tax=Lyophyllum shimeji TaxID=47721 RepID=A0A9P3UKN7_LYOSH|nr:putative CAMK CAMKL CHK1 protein kinase [Lyophyllum shimeji]
MSSTKYPKVVGFTLVKQIGGGGFSTVFRAVNFEDHRVAACKMIAFTEKSTDVERKTIEKEMRIHSALKHQHVLEFFNAVVVEMKHQHLYVPGIYMLLELAGGGDLFDKIVPDVGIKDDVAHLYFNQLLSGADYIHSQVYKLKDSGRTRPLTERCGSLPYVAPELNSDEPYQAEPVDVWGIGVILYAMLAGNTPWDEPTPHSPEFSRYLSGAIFDERPWNRFSADALSLICGLLTVDPRDRLTLADAFQHPWCMRPSQLASQGPSMLAEQLTEPMRANGDLNLAAPNLTGHVQDEDGDEMMASAPPISQFTQSLMLFSQTQSGSRYTPHLTRFYASLGHTLFMPLVQESLEALNVRCKPAPAVEGEGQEGGPQVLRLRIGGYDARKERFKGWVVVEKFTYRGSVGSYCVMQRDEGNPISWRQLWKALINSPAVEPHVLRK